MDQVIREGLVPPTHTSFLDNCIPIECQGAEVGVPQLIGNIYLPKIPQNYGVINELCNIDNLAAA